MEKKLNTLRLASEQAFALINLRKTQSKLIAMAVFVEKWRKKLKECFKRLPPKVEKSDKLLVLVHVKGGIGDVAMTRVYLSRLREALPGADIKICFDSKAVVDMLFSDGKYIDSYISPAYNPQNFDLVIEGSHSFTFSHYDEARIKALAPTFLPAFKRGLEMQKILNVYTKNPPQLDGVLAKSTVAYGSSRVSNMGLSTGIEVNQNDEAFIELKQEDFKILESFGLAGKKYITIHDGTNINTDLSCGYPTRCWPKERWREFAALFKAARPEILLVQIGGGANSEAFDFVDISLIGKTKISDLPYILKESMLHVDSESGMVHLANLLPTRAVVMFGPSLKEYLAYERNVSISAPFCGGCMNIDGNWIGKCILGYARKCACMNSIKAKTLFDAVIEILGVKTPSFITDSVCNIQNKTALMALQTDALINYYAVKSKIALCAYKLFTFGRALNNLRKNIKKDILYFFYGTAKSAKLKVLVHIRGGIGDLCMNGRFLLQLKRALPGAELTLCHEKTVIIKTLFEGGAVDAFTGNRYLRKDYDLVMSGSHIYNFDFYKRERIERLAPAFLPHFNLALERQARLKDFHENGSILDGVLAGFAMENGYNNFNIMGFSAGLDTELPEWNYAPAPNKSVLDNFGLREKEYITIHDGIGDVLPCGDRRPTRSWPAKYWEQFIADFKAARPGLKVVQLGSGDNPAFNGVDITLINKTSFRELLCVLQKSKFHVDVEAGVSHLAGVLKVKSAVLYGPSMASYFGYENNINISAQNCSGCMWIAQNWLVDCILKNKPECMQTIMPDNVLSAVIKEV